MVTKRRKPDRQLIKKRKSTAPLNYEMVNDRLVKDLLSTYLRELGRIPLLTVEEEKALAKEIQVGQRDLVHRLLKLDLENDEIDILIRKQPNISDELLAAIVGKMERLEKEDRIPPRDAPFIGNQELLCAALPTERRDAHEKLTAGC